MTGRPIGLKPENADCAEQSQQRSELKLPLANDPTFIREKDEREERGHNGRRTNENGVNTGAHVMKRKHLSDLVDNIGQSRQQTDAEYIPAEARAVTTKASKGKGQNRETRQRIAVEILGKRIVVAVEVKLEERWRRPDEDGGEDRGVTLTFAWRSRGKASLDRRHGKAEIEPPNFFGDKRIVLQIRFKKEEP